MPTPIAKIAPWDDTLGQAVALHDETGRIVARLEIAINADAAGDDQDIDACAGHVARWIVKAFEALARVEREDAHAEVMARIAEKQIA